MTPGLSHPVPARSDTLTCRRQPIGLCGGFFMRRIFGLLWRRPPPQSPAESRRGGCLKVAGGLQALKPVKRAGGHGAAFFSIARRAASVAVSTSATVRPMTTLTQNRRRSLTQGAGFHVLRKFGDAPIRQRKSTVTVDPQRGERLLATLPCGAGKRPKCGISAANSRIRPEYSFIRSRYRSCAFSLRVLSA